MSVLLKDSRLVVSRAALVLTDKLHTCCHGQPDMHTDMADPAVYAYLIISSKCTYTKLCTGNRLVTTFFVAGNTCTIYIILHIPSNFSTNSEQHGPSTCRMTLLCLQLREREHRSTTHHDNSGRCTLMISMHSNARQCMMTTHTRTYMAVQLLDEGLGPVLLLMPLFGMCKGPPHAIVDHNIVLVLFQQSRTCIKAQTSKRAGRLGHILQHSCRQDRTGTSVLNTHMQ